MDPDFNKVKQTMPREDLYNAMMAVNKETREPLEELQKMNKRLTGMQRHNLCK